jgi:post-segregation antitoxin (ccd killing protein)
MNLSMAATQPRAKKRRPETMVTTIELPRDLYQRAKIQAVLDHTTFRALVEQALRAALARKETK